MWYIVTNICVRHRIFTVWDFLLVLCSCSIYILEKVTLKDHFYSALGLLVLGLYFFERKKVSNHMAISYVSIQYAAWILTSCQLPGGLHLPVKYHLSLGSNAQWVSCPVPLTRPVLFFLSLMSKPPHKNAYHYASESSDKHCFPSKPLTSLWLWGGHTQGALVSWEWISEC